MRYQEKLVLSLNLYLSIKYVSEMSVFGDKK